MSPTSGTGSQAEQPQPFSAHRESFFLSELHHKAGWQQNLPSKVVEGSVRYCTSVPAQAGFPGTMKMLSSSALFLSTMNDSPHEKAGTDVIHPHHAEMVLQL